ncbi:MAG: DUF192 domain-containing protein [Pseudomonadota bacterium]
MWLMATNIASAACSPDKIDLRGSWGQTQFSIEVVDTPESRGQGLMNRPSLGQFAGMLFVYERPQSVAFWMKNTLIPLDMIFAGADGVVRRVHSNAIPGDLTSIPGGPGIQYVLEVNGGMAETLGIDAGSVMRHPSIDAKNASWRCN